MIYLREFILPKDTWVDCYFNYYDPEGDPDISAEFKTNWDVPKDFPTISEKACVNSWYPWNTFYGRGLFNFVFDDVTILYGGNGSGKTTLLNVIAQGLLLSRMTRYNRSTYFDDYVNVCSYTLEDDEHIKAIRRGRIVTSDDVFENMLQKREENDRKDSTRDKLFHNFYDLIKHGEVPTKNLTDPKVLEEFKLMRRIKGGMSCSSYIRSKLKANVQEYSNGETAFQYFVDAIQDNSLILLDEPENSLSAKWQIELTNFLAGASRTLGCQLIIATHSPFLLSIPGVKIYDLDSNPIKTNKWYNLENIRHYYQLFKDNEIYFE